MPSSSEATWHYELFAMLLLGSDCSEQKISLPAVSTGSRLQANLRRPLLLSCECRSTCSVLSETICQKHLETAISPISAGTQSILNTYGSKWTHTTTSQIYTNLNSDNKQQRQIHTCTKQENPSTISLCEALMEICRLQVEPLGTTNFLPRARWDLRTAREPNSSSCVHWLKASNKSAAPSAPFVSVSKHLQCFVRNNLSKTL